MEAKLTIFLLCAYVSIALAWNKHMEGNFIKINFASICLQLHEEKTGTLFFVIKDSFNIL